MANATEEVVDTTIDGTINIDPNNPKLTGIETERTEAINGYNTTIDGIISNTETMVAEQQAAIDESSQTLIDAQNDYTDATVGVIEGQKKEARQDYEDEARGAYVEWKLQSDPFGANAEHMAANGLSRSGYSESSKVRMYQSYQSRKALAYKAFSKAMTEYNNQITMARAQNSVTIAQIASDAIKEKARIALEGFYYKNDLIVGKANKEIELNQYYDGKWQDTYDRMVDEARDARDFNADQQWKAQEQANWEALYGEDDDDDETIIKPGDTPGDTPGGNGVDLNGNGVDDNVDDDLNTNGVSDDIDADLGVGTNPVTQGVLPDSRPSINFNPSLTTGNKSLDRMTNVANGLGNYPNFPTLPNGQAPHLTMEEVGVDNIHSVDYGPIKKALGDVSAEYLAVLVEKGYVKEKFIKDKDGKIGLTFEVVDKAKAKDVLTQSKGSGRTSKGLGAVFNVNK